MIEFLELFNRLKKSKRIKPSADKERADLGATDTEGVMFEVVESGGMIKFSFRIVMDHWDISSSIAELVVFDRKKPSSPFFYSVLRPNVVKMFACVVFSFEMKNNNENIFVISLKMMGSFDGEDRHIVIDDMMPYLEKEIGKREAPEDWSF